MVTLAGSQTDFDKALKELVELDFDAIEAYEAAINRLENKSFKEQMKKFKEDHERHVKEINHILISHGKRSVKGPSTKQWLTKGKIALGNLVGDDNTILRAMLSNEEDTNRAYKNINEQPDIWKEIKDVLARGLQDEKKHKHWLEKTLKHNEE